MLDHLGERGPLALLHLPPVEDRIVQLYWDVGVRQVLLELVELGGVLGLCHAALVSVAVG